MKDEGGIMNDEFKDSSLVINVEQLHRRIGVYDRSQILIWQRMSPVERLEVAFQAYQFALEAARLTERQRQPDLSEEDLKWRVIRRMQGDQRLGREKDVSSGYAARAE